MAKAKYKSPYPKFLVVYKNIGEETGPWRTIRPKFCKTIPDAIKAAEVFVQTKGSAGFSSAQCFEVRA